MHIVLGIRLLLNVVRRRTLVKSIGTVGAGIGIAGCSSEDSDGQSDGGDGAASGDETTGGGDAATSVTPTVQATPTSTQEESDTTHEVGETFEVGSGDQTVSYMVEDASVTNAIGTESLNEEAAGKYLVVILRIENTGDEALDMTSRNLKLIDSQEREFEADTGAAIYIEQDDRFDVEGITFDQLQPGLEVSRAVIFDVSPGESYAFKADPQGVLSGANSHYVPLGNVPA
jgi:hypothetical protein